jgi:hypothetical protein
MNLIGVPDELMDLRGLLQMMLFLFLALNIKIVNKDP